MSEDDSNDSFRKELSFTREQFPVDKDYDRLVDVFDSLELEEIQVTVSVSDAEAELYQDLFEGLFETDSEEIEEEREETDTVSDSDTDEGQEWSVDRFDLPQPGVVQEYSEGREDVQPNTQAHQILALLAAETKVGGDTWISSSDLEDLEYSPFTNGRVSSVLSVLFHEKNFLKRKGKPHNQKNQTKVVYRPTKKDREVIADLGRFHWPNGVEEPDELPPEEERPFVL